MNASTHMAVVHWRVESRLSFVVTLIAASIAFIVAVVGPAGYYWMSREAQLGESAVAARLHAAFVIQAIENSSANWREQVSGLIETDLAPGDLPERREIRDDTGAVVSASGPAVPLPTLSSSAPVVSRLGVVGEVVVIRSLQPILLQTSLVAALCLALGLGIYVTLRVLPLRSLRRTLEALKRKEANARAEAEENLRIVFDNAIEGIVMFTPEGRMLSGNPAVEQMFGYDGERVLSRSIVDLLVSPAAGTVEDPLPVGQWETVATASSGRKFPVDITVSESRLTGERKRIGIIRDITERKLSEARLSHLANFDSLTGLPNRTQFRDRLDQTMRRVVQEQRKLVLMFLDLDRFKTINDSLGHDIGDRLLKRVAVSLAECLRDGVAGSAGGAITQTVFRLGGDEFTVLVEGVDDVESVSGVAQRILDALARPFLVDEHELFISASIGITFYPHERTDLDGLIKQADMAMYRSKELGRNTYYFYSEELESAATERHVLETHLRHALERGEFLLHYQPKACLKSRSITGVEALLRWNRQPGFPAIGPDKFIPILEETGLIVPVGIWVIRTACEQIMAWRRAGLAPLSLAVNLSARQFRQHDLNAQIAAILADTGMDAASLEIELTESMLAEDSESVLRIMTGFTSMGVRVAIDDFGTGHSSLSYLKRFNVDTLKIDRSFVRDTPDDPEDNAIAIAVIALAHGLRLKVVAEGVETEAQAEFLRQQDCDEIQGYLLSRPLDPQALSGWLIEREHRMRQGSLASMDHA